MGGHTLNTARPARAQIGRGETAARGRDTGAAPGQAGRGGGE
jgi:hypothetical protein